MSSRLEKKIKQLRDDRTKEELSIEKLNQLLYNENLKEKVVNLYLVNLMSFLNSFAMQFLI
jgi:hypothetical protein